MDRDRFSLLLEHATEGYWDWDVRSDRAYLSPSYRRLAGLDPGQEIFSFSAFLNLVHPDDLPRVMATVSEYLASGRDECIFEFRMVTAAGEVKWMRGRGVVVEREGNGSPVRLVGTISDITEWKREEEELRFTQFVVDNATAEIYWADRTGRLVYVNRRGCEGLGYPLDELLTMRVYDVDPDFPPEAWAVWWEQIREEQSATFETTHRTRDGRIIPKEVSVSYVRIGERELVCGFAREIGERKRAEKLLRESEQRLRLMVEHLPAGAVYREGEALLVNRAAEKITGYPRGELDTMEKFFHVLFGDQAEAARDWYEEERAAFFPAPRTVPLTRRDGELRLVEFTGYRSEEGEVWLMHDATERLRAEEEIRRLNAELEQRVRERTTELESFCYSVSHDLRAPLRHIAGYSRILQEECGCRIAEECSLYLSRIDRAAVRMGELVDGLLALSLVGREEIHRVEVDLGEIVREVARELAAREPERQVEVVAGEAAASGDPRLLHTLLENLLGNAWKFTARTAGARIEFGAVDTGKGRSFFVRDNGAGFDMQYSDKLFGTFERLHGPDDFPGTGIGLAIVQRIVRRHGGTVWAESEVGRGATFFFTLG